MRATKHGGTHIFKKEREGGSQLMPIRGQVYMRIWVGFRGWSSRWYPRVERKKRRGLPQMYNQCSAQRMRCVLVHEGEGNSLLSTVDSILMENYSLLVTNSAISDGCTPSFSAMRRMVVSQGRLPPNMLYNVRVLILSSLTNSSTLRYRSSRNSFRGFANVYTFTL